MIDIEELIKSRREALTRDLTQNKKILFEKLKQLSVGRVEVVYDGSSDAGQIESYYLYSDSKGDHLLPEKAIEIVMAFPIVVFDTRKGDEKNDIPLIQTTIENALESLCYNYLELHHSGWENDEGGQGQFSFQIEDNKLEWEHSERIIELISVSYTL